jgi:riboflavin biosynthesis pyrimidine reductase
MLQQLYPAHQSLPLTGTYLSLNLHQRALSNGTFIYANYISSLDGRISLFDDVQGEYVVPKSIANARDWRLYQELAGQSDVMLTSARYFRQLAKGKAQDLLPVGSNPDYDDIRLWREEQGLKVQPDVVVLSNSLEIPLAALAKLSDRKVIVLTGNKANKEKIDILEQAGAQVLQAEDEVNGHFVRESLMKLGYQSAYMIAGPKVHQTLVLLHLLVLILQ